MAGKQPATKLPPQLPTHDQAVPERGLDLSKSLAFARFNATAGISYFPACPAGPGADFTLVRSNRAVDVRLPSGKQHICQCQAGHTWLGFRSSQAGLRGAYVGDHRSVRSGNSWKAARYRDLAEEENEAERFFMNVVLCRVLYTHALVAAPRMSLGWLRPLAPVLGDPRLGMTGSSCTHLACSPTSTHSLAACGST
jgi:hypothetical protein